MRLTGVAAGCGSTRGRSPDPRRIPSACATASYNDSAVRSTAERTAGIGCAKRHACSRAADCESLCFGALAYSLNLRAARCSSTSQSATRFSAEQPLMSLDACPPAPIEAIFSSLIGRLIAEVPQGGHTSESGDRNRAGQ